MRPQHSFSLQDGMHARHLSCEHVWHKCSIMHVKGKYNSRIQSGVFVKLSDCLPTYESSYPPTRLGRGGRTHYVGIPPTPVPKHSKFRPPDKRIQYNRMNGSPGDPPDSCFSHNQSLTHPPGEGVTTSKSQSLSRFSLHRLMPAYGTGLSTDAGTCKQITSTKLKE
jgi:hypothetical protein